LTAKRARGSFIAEKKGGVGTKKSIRRRKQIESAGVPFLLGERRRQKRTERSQSDVLWLRRNKELDVKKIDTDGRDPRPPSLGGLLRDHIGVVEPVERRTGTRRVSKSQG